MTEHRVLLVVSGTVPDDLDDAVAQGRRPRADYRVLCDRMAADLVDIPRALAAVGRPVRSLSRLIGGDAALAWYCFRRRRDHAVVFTDSERVGLLLALLFRLFGRGGCRHAMIAHIVSTRSKSALVRVARLAPMVDRWVVYCSWQRDFVVRRFGVPPERVVLTPFMVDSAFFTPGAVVAERRRMICAVGLERRDYATLVEAVDGLDVEVVIAAASPWSRQGDTTRGRTIPANVQVRRFSQFELRQLYAESAFTVMPLFDVEFQAGITAILESMAMERAVLCSRTPGQNDTIVDDVTGRYVPTGDPHALRSEIVRLLQRPDECARMGRAAREWVASNADIDVYAGLLAPIVAELGDS